MALRLRLAFFLRERIRERKCLSTADLAFEASRRMLVKLGKERDEEPVDEFIQLKSLATSLAELAVRDIGPVL